MSKGHYTIVVFLALMINMMIIDEWHNSTKISLPFCSLGLLGHWWHQAWAGWDCHQKYFHKDNIFRLDVTKLQMQCCQTKDVYSPGDPGQPWVGQSWKLPPTPSSWWLHHFSGSGDFCFDVCYTKRFKVKSKNLVFTPHCNALDIVSVIEIQSTKLKWK